MSNRAPELAEFLESVAEAVKAQPAGPEADAAMQRIYAALRTPGPGRTGETQSLPVCDYLPDALAKAKNGSSDSRRVADAFAALAPSLNWKKRAASGPFASENWPDGHANTMIVGPGGLEERRDIHIGASLLAPEVRYPDHNHGPEEVYLVLSRGRFQHGASDWFEPGLGGTLYNEPNIKHAMASDADPLLAIWLLWVGQPA